MHRGDRDGREARRGGARRSSTRRSSAPLGPSVEGDASALVSAGNTGAALAASLLHVRRLPGVSRPGIAIVIPGRRRANRAHRRRRERGRSPRAPRAVRPHGRRLRRGDPRRVESVRATALDRRGAREGEPADAGGARAPRSVRRALRRQRRGAGAARRLCRRRRLRRLHRQRGFEDAGRDDPRCPRGAPRARSGRLPVGGSVGSSSDPRRGASVPDWIPRRTAAGTSSGSEGSS